MNCCITLITPVLDLLIKNNVVSTNKTETVFIPPTIVKNSSADFFLDISWARIVACAAPNAGRTAIKADETVPFRCVFQLPREIESSNFCSGILFVAFALISKVEMPKSPANRGNKGSFIGKVFKASNPKIPDKRKTSKDQIFFLRPFSLSINNAENIRIIGAITLAR